MTLITTANGDKAYMVTDVHDLYVFLEPEVKTIGYDVETYLTKLKLGKNNKPLTKQPGHNPWNARTRLHQFYSPLVIDGVPLVVDTKNIDREEFKEFLQKLFFVKDDVKIFAHYAIFDGSFLYSEFGVFPKNLHCTQIQSQVYWAGLKQGLSQSENNHKIFTLASCYQRLFGGEPIDKTLQSSDWSGNLSNDQIIYAANDVVYCHAVGERLETLIKKNDLDRVERDEQYGLKAFIFARVKGQSIDIDDLCKLENEYSTVAEHLRLSARDCFNSPVPNDVLSEYATGFKNCLNAYIRSVKIAFDISMSGDFSKVKGVAITDSGFVFNVKPNPNQQKIITQISLIKPVISMAFNPNFYQANRQENLEQLSAAIDELIRLTNLLFNSKHLKDQKELKAECKQHLTNVDQIVKIVFGFVDLNPNSSTQMKIALQRIGVDLESTGSKVLSAFLDSLESENDEDEDPENLDLDLDLDKNAIRAMNALMLYRSVVTGLRYIRQFKDAYNPTTRAIHGEFRPMAPQGTGRSGCGKPAIQIVPRLPTSWRELGLRGIREAFKHPDSDYKIISLDSAGCHVQIARTYSQCPTLVDCHINAKDPYTVLGVEILKIQGIELDHDSLRKIIKDKQNYQNYKYSEARQLWKKVFLSCLNGAGARKIFVEVKDADPPIKGVTLEDCELAVKVFHKTFYGLSACQKELVKIANSYEIESPFGCWQTYKVIFNGAENTLTTNKYALAKSIDGGRYFIPMTYRSFDLEKEEFDPDLAKQSAKNTEVLAFSWQRVEGSCVKYAAFLTVMWLIENKLDHLAWLCNLNHDEKVIIAHESIAMKVAEVANGFLQQSFRRYVPDYLDRADLSEKILNNWSEKN
jgi:3'-5' exonuclease